MQAAEASSLNLFLFHHPLLNPAPKSKSPPFRRGRKIGFFVIQSKIHQEFMAKKWVPLMSECLCGGKKKGLQRFL